MKKLNRICLVLIALCLAVFFGYRMLDRMQTDTQPPVITMDAQSIQLSVQDDTTALLQGVHAQDNVDGDVTASLVVENISLVNNDGSVIVSYAAFDRAGNVAKAQREATYTDYESPSFSLTQPMISLEGIKYDIMSCITASDYFDGDISHRIRATPLDSQDITAEGTHNVEFRVTNSLGDTTKIVLPVEVYSRGKYDAQLTLTDYMIHLPVGAVFVPENYLEEYTLGTETTWLRRTLPDTFDVRISGQVNTQVPGVYPVSYIVAFTRYEQEFLGYSKLIVVVEG